MTVVAVVLMATGLLCVLRATLIVARKGTGRSRVDLPVSIVGGFALLLAGQQLLQK